ncbi:MAG: CBS domain-containing protein [Luteolibacter sp.]|jgi:CBS domain-containing protein
MEIQGTVHDILRSKQSEVWTTTPQATVYEAIGLMGEHNIGALVVIEDGQVVGVLSERDYSRKVVLRGRTSRDTRVDEIITRPAITVDSGSAVELCMELMTKNRIRHLPVVDAGELIGLVSMGDIVNWMLQTQRHLIQQLHGYIAGDYPV